MITMNGFDELSIKILDAFCGIGGAARGIHKAFIESGMLYTYTAVDNDYLVAKAHELNNPESDVIIADAYEYIYKNSDYFNFIWASPPCQSHSRINRLKKYYKQPDQRLYELIRYLQEHHDCWIVENVVPYYEPAITYTLRIGRHVFWSNMPLQSVEYYPMPKSFRSMNAIHEWENYHGLTTLFVKDKRQALRNAVHWSISYGLVKQIIEQKWGA